MRSDALLAVKEFKIRSDEFAAIIEPLASPRRTPTSAIMPSTRLSIQKLDDETARRLIDIAGTRYPRWAMPIPISGVLHFLGSRGALAVDFRQGDQRDREARPIPWDGPYRQEAAAEAYFHITGDASLYVPFLHAQLKHSGFDRDLMYKLAAVGPPPPSHCPISSDCSRTQGTPSTSR